MRHHLVGILASIQSVWSALLSVFSKWNILIRIIYHLSLVSIPYSLVGAFSWWNKNDHLLPNHGLKSPFLTIFYNLERKGPAARSKLRTDAYSAQSHSRISLLLLNKRLSKKTTTIKISTIARLQIPNRYALLVFFLCMDGITSAFQESPAATDWRRVKKREIWHVQIRPYSIAWGGQQQQHWGPILSPWPGGKSRLWRSMVWVDVPARQAT